ncbi:MAG: hypothetical protein JJU27_14265 [Gammaproteobacteria bacterium]|nr:hypothetical protein [Gammaproteobacteria bacterium]
MSDRRLHPQAFLLACLTATLVHAGPVWGAPTLERVDVHPAEVGGLHAGEQIQVQVRLAGGGFNPAPVQVAVRIQLEGTPGETVNLELRCPLLGCGAGYRKSMTYRLPGFCAPAARVLRVHASAGGRLREASAQVQAALPARANLAVRQPLAARPEFNWTVREAASHCPATSQVLCIGPQRQVADVSGPRCQARGMVRAFRFSGTSVASFALPEDLDFSGAAVAVLARCDMHGRCVPSLPLYFVLP